MMDDPNRLVEVFTEALKAPVGERAAYLEQACGGDDALRHGVEALLEAHGTAGDFLEQPVHGPATNIGAGTGERIGRYHLLEQIGEGGCGVVFMAEQEEPVRRKVALKIIKPGMDTKSVIARFQAERQALAMMDHPNIAKVFDAGATEQGRPFFVMELVRGSKLTAYCDEHSLSTSARLELFMLVCEAVQHAHQKGIIHRDLKPSNILVTQGEDGRALPMVIDFGIAKATTGQRLTDHTLFTAFEMLIGTPAYMSPEQAAMTSVDVDTRTDVYSLGVLLYELLTGTTPFDTRALLKAGLDEVRRVIHDEEPVRPSTRLSAMPPGDLTATAQRRQAEAPKLIRAIRGDLDCIVAKALEKDRNQRYATASGLADDVRRHLAHETISARAPSHWHQFTKLVRRNRLVFVFVGMAIAVLATALSMVTMALKRETHARQDADEARKQALADKATAEKEATRSQQVTSLMSDMLRGAGPAVAAGRDSTLLREIMDQTAARLETQLPGQPEVEAALRMQLGRTYWEIGRYVESETMYRRAWAIATKLHSEESAEAAQVLNLLGHCLSMQDRHAEAEEMIRRALEIRRRVLGERHPDVADSLSYLASAYWSARRLPEAEATYREAVKLFRGSPDGEDSRSGDALLGLGNVLFTNGKYAEAEEHFRGSMERLKEEHGEDHPATLNAMNNLGVAMRHQAKFREAEPLLRRALEGRRKFFGEQHELFASSLQNVARCIADQHQYAEAEVLFRRALTLQRKLKGEGDPAVVALFGEVVSMLTEQEKFAELDEFFRSSLSPGKDNGAGQLELLRQRVASLARRGRWPEAAADAAALVRLRPDDHLHYHTLAPLLVRAGNAEAYRALCETILAKFGETKDVFVADRMAKDCLILPHPGLDLAKVGRLATLAATGGANHPAAPFFQVCRAMAEYRQGNFADAVTWATKAKATPFPYAAAEAWAVLAMAQARLGNSAEARGALEKGMTLVATSLPKAGSKDLGDDWVDWIIVHTWIAEAASVVEAGGSREEGK